MSTNGKQGKNPYATNLLKLQNHIKRDPTSYKDEFLQTFHNYESTLQVYLMKPAKPNKQLADLCLFLSHVSHCFPDELKTYPQQLIDLLKKFSTVLCPDMRMSLCQCLTLMRSKNLIEPISLFDTFFSLMKCQDKNLRKFLYEHMLNDVKKIKLKNKDHKLCSKVQQFVFALTKNQHPQIAKYATLLMIDLYKKKIWNDSKSVNVIGTCCFSKTSKVVALALHFFNGKDVEEIEEDESDDDDKKTEGQLLMGLRVGKKSKGRVKKTQKAVKALKKDNKSKKNKGGLSQFSALNLIYDPQDFAEKLFKLVESTNEGFEMKLSILDLVSRLIGIHSLFLLNFHPFLLRFLNPHQREVTRILWFAAISSHDMTPPDTVEPILAAIANNFITERNNSEVITVGINSIREISSRCPLAMTDNLLADLIEYKTYKDKGVSTAAKSLIALFREKNPNMLHKRMRGKPTEATYEELEKTKSYGDVGTTNFIPGAEVVDALNTGAEDDKDVKKLLENGEEWESCSDDEEDVNKETQNRGKKRKHSECDSDSDSEDWVNVSGDEDDAGEENPELEKLTLEEKRQKAIQISSEKIFTQEDFKKIRQEQIRKKLSDKNFVKSKDKGKMKNFVIDSDSDNEETKAAKRDNLITMSAITSINKKKKQDKKERMETIMKGREGRDKFGDRKKESRLGKTNTEKKKSKPMQMVKHKMNKKFKRSFKDKQISLKKSLLKQKKFK